jgi:carboxylate-amine ligase
MLTCGLHIHVGLADADRALAVHNALRSYLPELASLSANSPYHESRRTGLASTRRMLTRSLARHGVPPAFPDWNAYAGFSSWARAGASIPDPSYQWWDLRLHPGYGTLEMRVCDTQTEVEDSVALVALVQTLVAWLAERHDAGETLPVHDDHRLTESLWVASRDSATPEILDLETGARRPTDDRIAELLSELAPTARELGAEADLERLRTLAVTRGADLQQQFVGEQGLDRLVSWLARRTSDSARTYLRQTDAAPGPIPVEACPAGGTRRSVPASA